MSQKDRIEIELLKQRVDALEDLVTKLEERLAERDGIAPGFRARHFGFGKDRWKVVNSEGVATGDQWLSREDAEAQARELNAALEGMEAA